MAARDISWEDIPTHVPKEVVEDFRNCLYLIWNHLNLPEPTKGQYEIANELQHGPNNLIVEAFRGVGKSWITAAFVCWMLLRNPQLTILVVSAGRTRAANFSTFVLKLINEMPILHHLQPRTDQRRSTISFDVGPARPDQAPSVSSVGISGQMVGSRADLIIFDDIEINTNSDTVTKREKIIERSKEFAAIRKPGGRTIGLGTPQSDESVYADFAERNYSIRIFPARYPDEKLAMAHGDKLMGFLINDLMNDPSLVGQPTDTRFTDEDLIERELEYGATGFARQFLLDTRRSDGMRYPLRLADLITTAVPHDMAPERFVWGKGPHLVQEHLPCVGFNGDRYYAPAESQGSYTPYTGAVMTIDPSGRGTDETTYCVVKHLHGQLYLTAAGGILSDSGYSEETLSELARIAKAQKVNRIVVEGNFGDGMFLTLFQPVLHKIYSCTCEEVKHYGVRKEVRIIDTLEPVLNQHRLIVTEDVIQDDYSSVQGRDSEHASQYRLFYQLTHITRDKGCLRHDDRLDALAMAVKYWMDLLAQDVDKAVQRRRDELEEAAYETLMESTLGNAFKKRSNRFAGNRRRL